MSQIQIAITANRSEALVKRQMLIGITRRSKLPGNGSGYPPRRAVSSRHSSRGYFPVPNGPVEQGVCGWISSAETLTRNRAHDWDGKPFPIGSSVRCLQEVGHTFSFIQSTGLYRRCWICTSSQARSRYILATAKLQGPSISCRVNTSPPLSRHFLGKV